MLLQRRKKSIDIIVALLILLFAYSGLTKLMDYQLFRNQLLVAPWRPLTLSAPYTALVLPLLLLFIVVLLLRPSTRVHGLQLSLLAMAGFTIYTGALLVFVQSLPCNCAGVLPQLSWEWHFVLNIGFTLLTIIALLLHRRITTVARR